MKKFGTDIRSASLLLFAALLCAALPSCGDEAAAPSQTPDAEKESAAVTEQTAEDTVRYKADYLPEVDYEGYNFRMITVESRPSDVEKEDGDIVNDAYYRRNRLIEERCNIVFSQSLVPDYNELTASFRRSVGAGSDDFDLCRLIMRDAFSCALDGYVAPVSSLPYVDITQDWYIHYVNDELTIKDNLFFAYSDECIDAFDGVLCVFFNKRLIENLDLESPYDAVRSGTWTVDKFFGHALEAMDDVNGDGKFSIDTDRYGIIAEHDMLLPSMWIGAGMKTIEKQDGIPYFSAVGNDRLFTLLTKVYDYWNTKGVCYDDFLEVGFDDANRLVARLQFAGGSSLFTVTAFGNAEDLRDMKDDFGIVPTPKYDEAQETYFSRLCDGWLNIPPSCAPDLERTSIIMEHLAVESKNYVIPAVYNEALLNKYIRDEDTIEMLDIIQKNRVIDLGDTIWYNPVRGIFVNCYVNHKPEFASTVNARQKVVDKQIEKTINSIGKLLG